ncbi:MAG: ChaN family lipoprotein [Deltaproteobacteria bacterium]|nr:ChaN family lipoprotein [Deltaproteobacteria bacterium]
MSEFSPRKELLQLQKRIFRKNRRLIESSVIHSDKTFKAYERRYLNAVRRYQSVATIGEVEEAMAKARVIYVGDYHTLNQSQRSFLRVLRSFIQKTRHFCIGLEVIQSRHQEWLDKYVQGKISDRTFLKKVGFREHWFFDLWENFRPIFDFARYHRIPLYGIEASPGLGASLEKRDAETARRIYGIYRKNPELKIFVFIGDLHLAGRHLPLEVEKIFAQAGIPLKTVTLFQNGEAIYWKLADKKIEDQVIVVKISGNEFCRMHTPPIIAQQSYLNWLEHEEGVFDYADAKQSFLDYVDRIAGFLSLKPGPEKEEVEVFTCGDLSFLKKLKGSGKFSASELREIKRQILRSESYTIPKMKYVYIANVSVNHAAEEASHYLKYLSSGEELPRPMQDAFYANILHEAIGFFGSKIINHRRKCSRPSDFVKLLRYLTHNRRALKGRGLEYRTALFFLEHERKARKGMPFHPNTVKSLSVDLFLAVTHAIGYYLGERMFYRLLGGGLSKDYVRDLFCDSMEEEGEPVRRYFQLSERLKGVKLPKRV